MNALEIDYRFLAPVSALPKTPLKRPQQGSLDPSPEPPLTNACVSDSVQDKAEQALETLSGHGSPPTAERAKG